MAVRSVTLPACLNGSSPFPGSSTPDPLLPLRSTDRMDSSSSTATATLAPLLPLLPPPPAPVRRTTTLGPAPFVEGDTTVVTVAGTAAARPGGRGGCGALRGGFGFRAATGGDVESASPAVVRSRAATVFPATYGASSSPSSGRACAQPQLGNSTFSALDSHLYIAFRLHMLKQWLRHCLPFHAL